MIWQLNSAMLNVEFKGQKDGETTRGVPMWVLLQVPNMPGSMTVACKWGQNLMGSSFVATMPLFKPKDGGGYTL